MKIESFEHNGLTVEIHQDEDAMNPVKEYDNFGKMACWHRRYELGHEQPSETPEEFIKSLPKDTIIFPLYLMDHSGLSISMRSYGCKWDSGQVGIIYATPEDVKKEYNVKKITKQVREKVIKLLEGEVETYDQYLRGDVYGVVIKNERGENVESCWGFFGFDYCKEEAKGMADCYSKQATKEKNELETKLKELEGKTVSTEFSVGSITVSFAGELNQTPLGYQIKVTESIVQLTGATIDFDVMDVTDIITKDKIYIQLKGVKNLNQKELETC